MHITVITVTALVYSCRLSRSEVVVTTWGITFLSVCLDGGDWRQGEWYNELMLCSSIRLPTEVFGNVHIWLFCLNMLFAGLNASMPQPVNVACGGNRYGNCCDNCHHQDGGALAPVPLWRKVNPLPAQSSAPLLVPIWPWHQSVSYSLTGCFRACVPLQYQEWRTWTCPGREAASPQSNWALLHIFGEVAFPLPPAWLSLT